jgi:hypothetical protein
MKETSAGLLSRLFSGSSFDGKVISRITFNRDATLDLGANVRFCRRAITPKCAAAAYLEPNSRAARKCFLWQKALRPPGRFMEVATANGGKLPTVRSLSPKALYELAAPSTPPEVQAEVERRVAAGEPASALAHWWPTPPKYGGGRGGARRASAVNS